ncbi:MAG: hypothetical protein ACUVXG_10200 [Anaerolineae bacterium]
MPLDPHQFPTSSKGAFWLALAAVLPGSSPGDAVYLLEPGDGAEEALLQVRRRTGRPEADLVYIAPTIQGDLTVREAWRRLLTDACRTLGEQGVERVYAGLPESDAEVGVFQEAGFVLYAHEDLFRLEPGTVALPKGGKVPVQARTSQHEWGLERLYSELVPWLVQQAEGGATWNGFRSHFPAQEVCEDQVLLEKDEIVGLLQVGVASGAFWLHVILHPRAYHWAKEVIVFGLTCLEGLSPRPVYCAVRHYQGGLRTPLEDLGFQWAGTRALLVRQTVARVRATRVRWAEGMEKHPEAAVPTALGCHAPETSGRP